MCRREFLRSVHDLLKPGGEFFFKTDHEPYFEEAEEVLESIDFFERMAWPAGDREFYPETDFERHWLAEGRRVRGLRLRKAG